MAQKNKINERQQSQQNRQRSNNNQSTHSDLDIERIVRKNLSQLVSPLKKMTKSSKKSETKNARAGKVSMLWQFVCGVLNSIPIVLMMACCVHIIHKDYVARGSNFWLKHKHWGFLFQHDVYEEVKCHDQDYIEDRKQFPMCAPKHCARFFNDFVFTDAETDMLLKIAQRGFTYGESDGGASIFEVYSGIVSKGRLFANIHSILRKQNKRFLSDEEIEGFNNVQNKIIQQIESKFDVKGVYLTKPVFFSKITNQSSLTVHDEYWHTHIDKEQYEGFHYTALVYLNTHQMDYFGGRFVWIDDNNITESHEPRKGRLSVFSSGRENKHYVEKVISGTRYALTIPFTCDKKLMVKVDR